MTFRLPALVALAALWILGSASPARADDGSRLLSLPAFDAIAASGNFTVDVWAQASQSVRVSGDPSVLSRVRASVRKGTLQLVLLPDSHLRLFGSPRPPRVSIGLVRLDRVALVGACQLSVRRLTSPAFDLALGGASRAEVDGSVGRLTADLDGASHLSADHLTVRSATLALAGVSQASVHAVDALKIEASGASRVVYSGHPALFASLSGVASVHHR